ncbi:MAG: Trm112 family protein [Pirellulales bacterium]
MIRPELLKILVCPENRSPLDLASSELLAKINRAVAAGRLTNKAGRKVEKPLDGGLVRADRAVLYPIVDEIPMLLVDEAIPLDQPAIES